jgi:BspA type Leucine rich repeat region (6 copies)/Secretion system C-terminal sorting domain
MNLNKIPHGIAVLMILFSAVQLTYAIKPGDPPVVTSYTITIDDVEFDANTGMIMNYLNTVEKDILIPDTLNGVEVTAIRDYCFWSKNLTAVILPTALKEIGNRAFSTNSIGYVFIPASVVTIGGEAFDYNSLDSVDFEDNSYIRYIHSDAFGGQKTDALLTSFRLPTNANLTFKGYRGGDFLTQGGDSLYAEGDTVNNLSFTYQAICPYTLTEADVEFDAATGTITGYKNSYEVDIVIPGMINGITVNTIGDNAFRMEGLRSLVLPDGLKIIEYDAFNVNELEEVVIPTSVLKIEYDAFTDMEFSLKRVTFESESQIRIIEAGAFDFTDELNSIALPTHGDGTFVEYRTNKGIRMVAGEVFSDATLTYYAVCPYELQPADVSFDEATGTLTDITNTMERTVIIPGSFNGVEVKAVGDFISYINPGSVNSHSAPLINITFPGSVRNIAENAFVNNHLYSVTIETDSYLKKVGVNAFAGSEGLAPITFPNNLNEDFIEYRDGDGLVFTAGETFSSFTLPHYAIVPYIITPDDVNNTDAYGDPVRSIFDYLNTEEYCIIIPETLAGKHVEYIGKTAFMTAGVNELIYLRLPSTLEFIDESAFSGNSLTEITIPSSVTRIESYAFSGNKLRSVTVEEGITRLGRSAFYRNFIETVSLPSTIKILNQDVFYDNKLVTVELPDGLETIESGAFKNNLLESVSLPGSITSIGENAFSGNASALTSIALPNPVVKEGYTFSGWKDGNGNTVTEISNFETSYEAQLVKAGFTISGSFPSNLARIRVEISGDVTDLVQVSGSYTYALSAGRNVVITPHLQNYTFTPESITITDIQADISGLDFDASYTSSETGINDQVQNRVKIYPNPTSDFLHIESENTCEISVISLNGQTILSQRKSSGLLSLNVCSLPPGIYIVQLREDMDISNHKFIKK